MSLWTVYFDPADYPGEYIARHWQQGAYGPVPGEIYARGDTLESVRSALPPGLQRIPRQPGDDHAIVEVWL